MTEIGYKGPERRKESRENREADYWKRVEEEFLRCIERNKQGQLSDKDFAEMWVAKLKQKDGLARVDGLTGLRNRKDFNESLEQEIAIASAEGKPLGLVILDVDHFKKLNDTYGHVLGDDVLTDISLLLQELAPTLKRWHVARYGGEEFALILPGISTEELEELVKNIGTEVRDKLASMIKVVDKPRQITVSVGATMVEPGWNSKEAIKNADAGLYIAKREDGEGRSRDRGVIRIGEDEYQKIPFQI